jgi:hypothetical protein
MVSSVYMLCDVHEQEGLDEIRGEALVLDNLRTGNQALKQNCTVEYSDMSLSLVRLFSTYTISILVYSCS